MISLKRIRKRQGRCYELALKVMLYESESDSFTLVHGRVENIENGRFGHAWIELNNGLVYDTSANRYTPAGQYATENKAVVDHRYSRAEALGLACLSHNCGPWTDDERREATDEQQ